MTEVHGEFYDKNGHFPLKLDLGKAIEQQLHLTRKADDEIQEVESKIIGMVFTGIDYNFSPTGIFASHTEDTLGVVDHAITAVTAEEVGVTVPRDPRALSQFIVSNFTEVDFYI
jgi:hypothetical protein